MNIKLSILDLPIEMHREIFSHISAKDCRVVRLVCSIFNDSIQSDNKCLTVEEDKVDIIFRKISNITFESDEQNKNLLSLIKKLSIHPNWGKVHLSYNYFMIDPYNHPLTMAIRSGDLDLIEKISNNCGLIEENNRCKRLYDFLFANEAMRLLLKTEDMDEFLKITTKFKTDPKRRVKLNFLDKWEQMSLEQAKSEKRSQHEILIAHLQANFKYAKINAYYCTQLEHSDEELDYESNWRVRIKAVSEAEKFYKTYQEKQHMPTGETLHNLREQAKKLLDVLK